MCWVEEMRERAVKNSGEERREWIGFETRVRVVW